MKITILLLFAFFFLIQQRCTFGKEIHLSISSDPTQMKVTWITTSQGLSYLKYGPTPKSYPNTANGSSDSYNTTGYYSGIINYVTIKGLKPDTKYYYIVAEDTGYSNQYSFTTPPDVRKHVKVGLVADMGTSPDALDTVSRLLQFNELDIVMHPGDIAYANGDQPIWDTWFGDIESVAAQYPYMVGVGNHEDRDALVAYKKRFLMPWKESDGIEGNCFYSFNYGPIHFVMLSCITDCADYSASSIQYKWLEKDLQTVDRTETPWIIVLWHFPWYNSNQMHQGEGEDMRLALEQLLYENNVDLCVTGHVHAYERTYPVYNFKKDSQGPTHVVVGNSGAELYTTWLKKPDWSSYREAVFGSSMIEVNTTHLSYEMRRDADFSVADSFLLTK